MLTLSLLTDFSYEDPYLSLLKIKITKQLHDYRIVELSHNNCKEQKMGRIKLFENLMKEFEPATVHLILINTEYNNSPNFVSFQFNSQYIIAPDNGIMSEYYRDSNVYLVLEKNNNYDNIFNHLINHIKQLSTKKPWENLKITKPHLKINEIRENAITDKSIATTIFYIDDYGNLYCNLKKEDFEKARKNRSYKIIIGREIVTQLYTSIGDKDYGKPNAFFNTFKYLEISIGGANAAKMLGLKTKNVISIIFE